jgi:hypothetical protein
VVLDPFGGSGTTLIAAERTGRVARLIELDPRYVDVIVQRWQGETGGEAVLEDGGRTFNALAVERSGQQLTAVDAVDTAEPEARTGPRKPAAA